MDMLRCQLISHDEFERLKSAVSDSLTDLERAVHFLYLQRTTFGGKVRGQNLGCQCRPPRLGIHALAETLQDVHRQLSCVTIECLPFADVLTRYEPVRSYLHVRYPYRSKHHLLPQRMSPELAFAQVVNNLPFSS